MAALLVLSVVGRVNGSEDEFENPEVRGEVDWRLGASHLGRLVLEVGSAVDHGADLGVAVQLAKELSSLLVVADLRELESNCTRAEVGSRVDGVADGVLEGAVVLASRLTISDANDQDGLARLAELGQNDRINDLLAQFGAERRKTLVFLALQDGLDLLLRANALEHVRRDTVIVHEADVDTILVKQGCGKGHSLHDKLEILDSLAILLKGHRATVINVDDNVVQRKADDIHGDFARDAPGLAELVYLLGCALSDRL